MLFNNAIILLIILLFIYIITNQLFPYENLDNYSENNMLYHVSRDNVFLRTNTIDNENKLYKTSEYNMDVLVPPRLNCTFPAVYDRTSYSCVCSPGFIYDQIVGCKPICTNIERYDPVRNLCVADCQYGDWSDWTDCQLGSDARTRTRNTIPPKNGGAVCMKKGNIEVDHNFCPVDCSYGSWDSWTDCVPGSTIRSRTRYTIPPVNHGTACIPGANYQVDNKFCPVDCEYGPWDSWTDCVHGSATRSRTRNTIPPLNRGAVCAPGGNYEEDKSFCPIDCSYGSWEDWSNCVSGTNARQRTRSTIPPVNNGAACVPKGYLDVDYSYCPMDCVYGKWSEWSSCDSGVRTRTRNTTPPLNNGTDCAPDGNVETDTSSCPKDCVYGDVWIPDSCQTGISTRTYRRSIIQSKNGGAACPNVGSEETKTVDDCPVDCQNGTGDFIADTCQPGNQIRVFRRAFIQPKNGGMACPAKEEIFSKPDCSFDCKPGTGDFVPDACTPGNKTRTYRRAYIQPFNGGAGCPGTYETITKDDCPVDCQYNETGSSCKGNILYKTYTKSADAANGGNCNPPDGNTGKPCDIHAQCASTDHSCHYRDRMNPAAGGVQDRSYYQTNDTYDMEGNHIGKPGDDGVANGGPYRCDGTNYNGGQSCNPPP